MSGIYKILNRTRETICKNCMHFSKRIHPYHKKTMCIYFDIPTEADNSLKCSEYEEPNDPAFNFKR